MFARGNQGHPCKLADRHAREDLIVGRRLASSLRLLQALSSQAPPIEVRRCVEHLHQSCALRLSNRHERRSTYSREPPDYDSAWQASEQGASTRHARRRTRLSGAVGRTASRRWVS